MDASRMPRPTKRLRIRTHAPVNVTRCGAAAHTGAALRTWTDCPAWFVGRVRHKAAVHHPLTGWGRRPSALPGIAPSADGALGRWGVSPAAAGDQRRCLWTPRFWAVHRPLARVVGEEFCVRPRCGFAGILDVWQEATPQAWRKRPGEHRRHTGGGAAPQEKNRVKLLSVFTLPCLFHFSPVCDMIK